MERRSFIRVLYLYLFALLGLVLLTIGGVGFVTMGLRAYVFTEADSQDRLYREIPPRPYALPEAERLLDAEELSAEERTKLRRYLEAAEAWERRREDVDPVTAQRHRNAAENLALLLVGLPLYLYHWRMIRREP